MSRLPVGGACDADVRLPPADLRRGDLRVGLVVGGGEFLHEGQDGRRAADDQAAWPAAPAGTASTSARIRETIEGAVRTHVIAP